MLIHEATFAEDELERARETLHSTARQAGEVARDAQARMLALTHISSRYPGRELREQARAVFAETRGSARLRHDRDPVRRAWRAAAAALVRSGRHGEGAGAEPVAAASQA